MKYCPECDELIPLDAVYCQYCGINTQNPEDTKNRSKGDPETTTPAKKSSTSRIPHPIPLSHVIVTLLLLLATFWGLSLSLTVLPIFINPSNTNHLFAVAISVQVILRIIVAILALDGRYPYGKGTIEGKIATSILAFIPVGALYSFLYAARSISQRDYLPTITSSALGATALTAVLITSTYTPLTEVAAQINPDSIPIVDENPVSIPTQRADTTPNETNNTSLPTLSQPTIVVSNPQVTDSSANASSDCNSPSSISTEDEGEVIEICGRVTNFGKLDCKWCSRGYATYILLDKTLRIISYNYEFTFAWLGDCLRVSDTVEIYGDEPVFNFNRGEGYAGSKCIVNDQGELQCDEGGYFQAYDHCDR